MRLHLLSRSRSAPAVAFVYGALSLFVVACSSGLVPASSAEAHVSSTGSVPGNTNANAGSHAPEDGAAVPISTQDPSWGDRDAPVSIVLFGDLECPYTGKILKTMHGLQDKYGPTQLRIVWKDLPLPFHAQARPAAEAAEAVFRAGGQDAFWKFWDQALVHQSELSGAAFEGWALSSGVGLTAFRAAMDGRVTAPKVDVDMALAQRLHVLGTPTFFVNGTLVVGAQPLAKFTALVDSELTHAKERLAAGVTGDALYADRAKANWKAPVDEPEDDEPDDTKTVWRVGLGGGPTRGPANAPVTIVIFSDFQCPFCKRIEPTLEQVVRTYGDKVRIVWRDEPLPFHNHAQPAAELAREARAEKGDTGFWAAHDAIFEAQTHLEDETLLGIGHAIGLDPARVKAALETKKYAAQIQADLDAADDVQANGTPHLFINGRRLAGAQPFEAMKPLIDDELRHAADLLGHGVPPAGLYDAMMKGAKTPPLGEARQTAPRAHAPFRGPENAPVVIEEFADFECPFCTRADATLAEVAKRYGPRVKLVWRNLPLPFHAHAEEAAEAALEAQKQKGNPGFWAMHDKLFAHASAPAARGGDGSGLDRAALDTYAHEMGLDVAAFDSALDTHTHSAEVHEDLAAAEAAHIEGTPAFVVGGYLIAGAQPIGSFRRIIDQVLTAGPAAGTTHGKAAPSAADAR